VKTSDIKGPIGLSGPMQETRPTTGCWRGEGGGGGSYFQKHRYLGENLPVRKKEFTTGIEISLKNGEMEGYVVT